MLNTVSWQAKIYRHASRSRSSGAIRARFDKRSTEIFPRESHRWNIRAAPQSEYQRDFLRLLGSGPRRLAPSAVCTENLIRVDDTVESPKLAG